MKNYISNNIYLSILFLFSGIFYIPAQTSPIITAHRAGAGYAPENSLKAIENALHSDVARIELDVRMTKDSVLVLMHDRKINRTTNGKGKIKKLTFNELQTYYIESGAGVTEEKVPTLEQAFDLVNKKKTLVLEIKKINSNASGIEEKLIGFIQEHNGYDVCVVHSFCDKVLNKIHLLDSNIRLSKLFVYKPIFLPFIVDYRIRFKTIESYTFVEDFGVNEHFATRLIIKKIHKLGKKIHVWTPDKPKKIRKLLKKGVDGIITNKHLL